MIYVRAWSVYYGMWCSAVVCWSVTVNVWSETRGWMGGGRHSCQTHRLLSCWPLANGNPPRPDLLTHQEGLAKSAACTHTHSMRKGPPHALMYSRMLTWMVLQSVWDRELTEFMAWSNQGYVHDVNDLLCRPGSDTIWSTLGALDVSNILLPTPKDQFDKCYL